MNKQDAKELAECVGNVVRKVAERHSEENSTPTQHDDVAELLEYKDFTPIPECFLRLFPGPFGRSTNFCHLSPSAIVSEDGSTTVMIENF